MRACSVLYFVGVMILKLSVHSWDLLCGVVLQDKCAGSAFRVYYVAV